jgi:hypothetical protein
MDLTYRYLKNLYELRHSLPIRRLVWSLETRLHWSMESVLRTIRSGK